MKLFKTVTLDRALPFIIGIGSLVGLFASAMLIYDQVKIWRDPYYSPGCNLNPLLSCGSVINSNEGHVLGIPAPFLGLVMFSALGAIAITILAGAKFPRRFWQFIQLAMLGGVAFALWLFWLSLYRINALCPFCLLTDAAVYTMAWYVTLYNLQQGHIKLGGRAQRLANFGGRHHFDILVSIFIVIAVLILQHFWYYFGRNF